MNVVGDDDTVICLADSGNCYWSEGNTKRRILEKLKLLLSKDFVEVGGADSPLFQALLVFYRSHKLAILIQDSISILKAIVYVKEGFAACS